MIECLLSPAESVVYGASIVRWATGIHGFALILPDFVIPLNDVHHFIREVTIYIKKLPSPMTVTQCPDNSGYCWFVML
jgi:hypothetical protein